MKLKKDFYVLHVIAYFILTFGIGLIPYSGLPVLGMKVLGIFIGLVYGWTFLGFIWPSCISILALGFSGYDKPFNVLASGFSNEIVIFLILTMVYLAYCEDSGLSKKIAYWFLSRKFLSGHPWVFAYIVMLATYLLGICISGVQAMLLIWGILYGIYQELGYKKLDLYPAFLTFGTVFAAVASFSARPWTGVPMLALGSLNSISGESFEIPFLPFMTVASITYLIAFSLFLLIVKFVIRPDVTPFMNSVNLQIFVEMRTNLTMTKQERVAGYSFIAFLLLLFLPSFIPALKPLSMSITAILILSVLCIYRIDGKPALNFQKCASQGIAWNIVLMAVSMLPIASALSAENVGIVTWLNVLVGSLFEGMHSTTFLVIMIVICALITQIAHNAIAASMIIALGYPVSLSLGVDPLLMTVLISYAAGLALLTPAASTGAAIGFSNTEWIGPINALKAGAISVIVGIACIIVFAIPLGTFFIHG